MQSILRQLGSGAALGLGIAALVVGVLGGAAALATHGGTQPSAKASTPTASAAPAVRATAPAPAPIYLGVPTDGLAAAGWTFSLGEWHLGSCPAPGVYDRLSADGDGPGGQAGRIVGIYLRDGCLPAAVDPALVMARYLPPDAREIETRTNADGVVFHHYWSGWLAARTGDGNIAGTAGTPAGHDYGFRLNQGWAWPL